MARALATSATAKSSSCPWRMFIGYEPESSIGPPSLRLAFLRISLCVLCASVVRVFHHRDTESTELAGSRPVCRAALSELSASDSRVQHDLDRARGADRRGRLAGLRGDERSSFARPHRVVRGAAVH